MRDRRDTQRAWNEVSAAFLEGRHTVGSIDYGPLCSLEGELRLMDEAVGEMRGLSVLDAGCGGGQNAVCFAQQGAHVTALDFSEPQLDHARTLAKDADVKIRFLLSDVESLAGVPNASQDLVFCANVLPYVTRVDHALKAFRRVLRVNGLLVASMDHPFRACFCDADTSDLTNYAERSYFAGGPRAWRFPGAGATMHSYDRPTGAWIDLLRETGLHLVRLLEPPAPPEILDDVFPADGPLAGLRNIPHTLILVAGKTPAGL